MLSPARARSTAIWSMSSRWQALAVGVRGVGSVSMSSQASGGSQPCAAACARAASAAAHCLLVARGRPGVPQSFVEGRDVDGGAAGDRLPGHAAAQAARATVNLVPSSSTGQPMAWGACRRRWVRVASTRLPGARRVPRAELGVGEGPVLDLAEACLARLHPLGESSFDGCVHLGPAGSTSQTGTGRRTSSIIRNPSRRGGAFGWLSYRCHRPIRIGCEHKGEGSP